MPITIVIAIAPVVSRAPVDLNGPPANGIDSKMPPCETTAAQIAQAFSELRHTVARRAARIRRITQGLTMSMNRNQAAHLTAVPARQTELSPWREAVNEEQGASFGTLLKFVKGEWLIGEQPSPVGPTTMFIANLDGYWRGWIHWENREPTAHAIGRVVDRHRVIARGTRRSRPSLLGSR